jgi:hypothetical protein
VLNLLEIYFIFILLQEPDYVSFRMLFNVCLVDPRLWVADVLDRLNLANGINTLDFSQNDSLDS